MLLHRTTAENVLATILTRQLSRVAEECLPESQCFRQDRGIVDMILHHDRPRKNAGSKTVIYI